MDERAAFFASLSKCTAGERATLRRHCGVPLSQADGKAWMVFYRILPRRVSESMADRWFAVACFSCLWKPEEKAKPMEQVLKLLAGESDSMGRRLAAILDLPWDGDGFLLEKLSRILKMAKSKGYTVDCQALLQDLLYWNGEKQLVQRRWARAMYTQVEEE